METLLADKTQYSNGQWVWVTRLKWVRLNVYKHVPFKSLTHKLTQDGKILLNDMCSKYEANRCFAIQNKKLCQKLCDELDNNSGSKL